LEAKGLVTREIDQTDSRAKMITTTSGGAQLAQRALTAVQAVDRDFV
jgi:DNA-binding MarR family transcriptional regulator